MYGRAIAAVLALTVLTACEETTGSETPDVSGMFTLLLVDGDSVPTVVTDTASSDGGAVWTVEAGTLELTDGTYSSETSVSCTIGGEPADFCNTTFSDDGTYFIADLAIVMQSSSSEEEVTAPIPDSMFVLEVTRSTLGQMEFTYRRQ